MIIPSIFLIVILAFIFYRIGVHLKNTNSKESAHTTSRNGKNRIDIEFEHIFENYPKGLEEFAEINNWPIPTRDMVYSDKKHVVNNRNFIIYRHYRALYPNAVKEHVIYDANMGTIPYFLYDNGKKKELQNISEEEWKRIEAPHAKEFSSKIKEVYPYGVRLAAEMGQSNIINCHSYVETVKYLDEIYTEASKIFSKNPSAFKELKLKSPAVSNVEELLYIVKHKSQIRSVQKKVSIKDSLLDEVSNIENTYKLGYDYFILKNNVDTSTNEGLKQIIDAKDSIIRKDKELKYEKELKDSVIVIANNYNRGYDYYVSSGLIKKIDYCSIADLKKILQNKQLIIDKHNELAEIDRLYNEARSIVLNYPAGYEYYVNQGKIKNINECTSISEYQEIIRYHESCRIKQEEHKKQEVSEDIRSKVYNWHLTKYGIPHDYIYDYLPTNSRREASNSDWDIRNLIWAFKNDANKPARKYSYSQALDIIVPQYESHLRSTFGDYLSKMTLVCIPSSKSENNRRRWEKFAERVCRDLNMQNGYDHISITRDGIPKRENGGRPVEVYYDQSFFNGKIVIICDDIKTSGYSIYKMKNCLESFGATVICSLTIGKTVSD